MTDSEMLFLVSGSQNETLVLEQTATPGFQIFDF